MRLVGMADLDIFALKTLDLVRRKTRERTIRRIDWHGFLSPSLTCASEIRPILYRDGANCLATGHSLPVTC